MHSDGCIKHLKVHWFEKYGEGDKLTGKYRPWFVRNKSTNKKDVPWTDKITCDSVLNCFPTLTFISDYLLLSQMILESVSLQHLIDSRCL